MVEGMKECCVETRQFAPLQGEGAIKFRKCSCGLRHFEMNAEPGTPLSDARRVVGTLTVKVDNRGTVTLDMQNLERTQAALIAVLDEAKAIVRRKIKD